MKGEGASLLDGFVGEEESCEGGDEEGWKMGSLCFDYVSVGWWDEVVGLGRCNMEEERQWVEVGAICRDLASISSRGTATRSVLKLDTSK